MREEQFMKIPIDLPKRKNEKTFYKLNKYIFRAAPVQFFLKSFKKIISQKLRKIAGHSDTNEYEANKLYFWTLLPWQVHFIPWTTTLCLCTLGVEVYYRINCKSLILIFISKIFFHYSFNKDHNYLILDIIVHEGALRYSTLIINKY